MKYDFTGEKVDELDLIKIEITFVKSPKLFNGKSKIDKIKEVIKMDMYQKRKQRKEKVQNSDVKLDKTSINWDISI